MIEIFENDLEKSDLENINKLLLQLNPNLSLVDFDRVLELMKRGYLLSARDLSSTKTNSKGDLIGMITLIPILKLAASFGNIEDFIVLDSYRGHGIGKKMIESAIKKAKGMGLEHLFLTSNKQREVARAIYKKYDFKEYDSTPFKLLLAVKYKK